jgi:hypothetical protein
VGAVVAPFWQALALRPAPTSQICTAVAGAAPARRFAVEWQDVMPTGDTTTHVTFEAVLYEGANAVEFVYHQIDPGVSPPEESDGSWSAIALQSPRGTRYILHEGSVTTDTSVRWDVTSTQ